MGNALHNSRNLAQADRRTISDSLQATAGTLPPGCFVPLEDAEVWCRDSGGEGPALICLHPNTGTAESWQFQFPALAANGLRIIAFDRPGRGSSVITGAEKPMAQYLNDLADALGLGEFMVAAAAGGVFCALDHAAHFPGRQRGAVLMASTGQVVEPEINESIARIEIPEIRKQKASYRELGPSYRASHPEGVALWDAIYDHARSGNGAYGPPLIDPNTYAKVARVDAPCLVVACGADLIAPPPIVRMWADKLPRHQIDSIAEAGHNPHWERPDEVNARIQAFAAALARTP